MLLVTWNNILEPFQLQLHCCRLYWNKEHIKGSIPILLIGAVRFDKSNISQQYIMTLLACFTSYITHCTSLSVVVFGVRSSSLYFVKEDYYSVHFIDWPALNMINLHYPHDSTRMKFEFTIENITTWWYKSMEVKWNVKYPRCYLTRVRDICIWSMNNTHQVLSFQVSKLCEVDLVLIL